MLEGEDYVVVWVGWYRRIDVLYPKVDVLVRDAKKAGLQTWRDRFDIDEVSGPIDCLLIGRLVKVLGIKENRFRLQLSSRKVERLLESVRHALPRIRQKTEPALFVLLHVEDPE